MSSQKSILDNTPITIECNGEMVNINQLFTPRARCPVLTDRVISKDCVKWEPNKELMSIFEKKHGDSIATLRKHGLNGLQDKAKLMTLEEMRKNRS